MSFRYRASYRITPHVTGKFKTKDEETESFFGVSVPGWVYAVRDNRPDSMVVESDDEVDLDSYEARLPLLSEMANRLTSEASGVALSPKRTRKGPSTNPMGGPPWRIGTKGGHFGLLVPHNGELVEKIDFDCGVSVEYFLEIELSQIGG